jgi:hypothetical protein
MSEENQVLRAVTSAYQWQVNCELTPSNCKALLDHVEELENIDVVEFWKGLEE